MPKTLVIVESPAKAKTIAHYLGRDYTVKASVGHVRDLPQRSLGVDVEQGFRPTYQVSKGKTETLKDIAKAAASSDVVYLVTDPDREGEAIAWHVAEAAHLDPARTRRIAFHQVTREAVQEALAHPRDLDRDLIDAQQARRVLDRLVGYKISPMLSRILKKRLSAGRVQSVALRLVVEREREILAFVPEEYWTLDADLRRRTPERERFRARLFKVKSEDPGLRTQDEVNQILRVLVDAPYVVTDVRSGQRKRQPRPPFVTSTLQTEASSRLRFSPRQTMRLAQQLYEGIQLDGELVGLITYMRTDSTHVAPEAQQEARDYVMQRWGEGYLPPRPPVYRSKVANAQEAHEAIRPTLVLRTPEAVRARLTPEQARLYELIWQRFVASQMAPALYDTCSLDVTAAQDYVFRANGQTLVFAGYQAVYAEDDEEKTEDSHLLSRLQKGETVDLEQLLPEQHFTEPPPRYSEATLIQALEANGVGRPSTYASIVGVIQDRSYVVKERGRLAPTPLGMVVCDVLVGAFGDIMAVRYTAGMEEQLDRIASGELGYVPMLSSFYELFAESIERAPGEMAAAVQRALKADLPEEAIGQVCPQCGRDLQVRLGSRGRFLACGGYPECSYTRDLVLSGTPPEADVYSEERCGKCGGRIKIIVRGASRFMGCENYPRCKNTRPILSEEIQALAQATACPTCGQKPLEPRSGRYGEYLYCPTCQANHSLRKLGLTAGAKDAARPAETVDVACPLCGQRPLEKRTGRYGPYYRCPACKKNISEKKLQQAQT
jgi:DNA topoisomerase-1